ncbi:MAG: UvrD-helicase domain-containing protein [Deltaproteobacteria bacterium]|nr:UvrD-helicase domain-containing protein [Deltaproteobacteria bacterium]
MSVFRFQKPEVLARIPRDRDAVIEASAGTGKTFTLVGLVVDLLLERDARIEQILVVTFTEKAAGELRARIRQKLGELLALEADGRDVEGKPCWTIDDRARQKLRTALGGLDGATIATIHGFCQRTLGEQAFESGRLFEESQVDAAEAFERTFLDVLRTELATTQRAWVQAWLEHEGDAAKLQKALQDVAGLHGGLRPIWDEPAFLAAVDALPGTKGLDAEIAALAVHHSTKGAMRKRVAHYEQEVDGWRGRNDAPALLVEVRNWIDASAEPLLKNLGDSPFRRALQALVDAAPPFATAAVQVLLPPVTERLAQRKREQGQYDFDDMLLLLRDALRGPGGPALVDALRARYRYALVDEFQDTDAVQWEIFETAFRKTDQAQGELFQTASSTSRLYLIGDPKQAIYAFRGADVHTYVRATRTIGPAVPLEENFRSTQPLIDAVNTVLDQRATPPFFDGDIRYEHPVRCGKTTLALRDAKGAEVPPVALWHLWSRGELRARSMVESLGRRIADEVERLLDDRRGLYLHDGDERRRLGPGDVFVLTRKDREARELGHILRARGLAVAFYKQDGLFQTPEAFHVLDLLRAIASPGDLSACRKAWLTPFFALELPDVARADAVPPEHPWMARLISWKALADARDYERLFARILDESGLVRRLLLLSPSERELTNYQHLFEVLLQEAHRVREGLDGLARTLDGWVREVREPPGQEGNLQRLESDGQAVQVMTLHKSKGLEAPVVFLAGGFTDFGAQGLRVSIYHDRGERLAWLGKLEGAVKSQVEREALEEDQRLLYVGLTRAAARLYVPFWAEPLAADARAGASFVPKVALKGSHRPLNDRLARLYAGGLDAKLFAREALRVHSSWEEPVEAKPLPAWSPPVAVEPDSDPRPNALRKTHAGFLVTSYSRMAASRSARREEEENELFKLDLATPFVPLGPDELPPGAETGVFVHEVLENLPLARVAAAQSLDALADDDVVEGLIRRTAARHGFAERQVPAARRLAWRALRTPLTLTGGSVLLGIASAAQVLREVEFLFPIPEASHPLLGRAKGRFSIERGCIKGFIDLVFEHAGRAYLADWKTDHLAGYAPELLAAHVGEHYAIQERLYTLALVRLLGLRTEAEYEARFGGGLYLFVRGMGEGANGVHLSRARWANVVAWEAELLHRQDWGVRAPWAEERA